MDCTPNMRQLHILSPYLIIMCFNEYQIDCNRLRVIRSGSRPRLLNTDAITSNVYSYDAVPLSCLKFLTNILLQAITFHSFNEQNNENKCI